MIKTIEHLPNRHHIFSQKNYAIYVLDDYAVHLMPELRSALLKRGYILEVIGGGITGDIQINDTHFHGRLKSSYRDLETELMIEQLRSNPEKIPSPSRDQMMEMLYQSWSSLNVDRSAAFKSLWITNAFDGSEDYLVSRKLWDLVGSDMVNYRSSLMNKKFSGSLNDVMRSLIPPKGVHRSSNVEGGELLDCDGEELAIPTGTSVPEFSSDSDKCEDESTAEISLTSKVNNILTTPPPFPPSVPQIEEDSKFLDQMFELLKSQKTSQLFTPYLMEFKATYHKARKSLQKRSQLIAISSHSTTTPTPSTYTDCPPSTSVAKSLSLVDELKNEW